MQIYIIKILVFSALLLVSNIIQANVADESFVAMAHDKNLCKGIEGNFLPLPDTDSYAATTKYIVSVIKKKFGSECRLNGILIKGKITEDTLPQLQLGLNVLEVLRNEKSIGANTLWLYSPGGLILEAMKIGDMIAEKGMNSIVAFRGHCYSSCVFIYAAAKTRGGIGDVGIHRPFASEISADNLSYSEYLKKYDALTPVLKQYFSKYGVSPSLVDSMNVVSSDDIKILSESELESYGLGYENIAAKEHDKAITIQVCGQEYYDMHLNFFGLIKSCRKRFDIGILDDKDEECWALARQAYPNYSERSDECRAKRANRKVQ
ncbi:MAG: ATP-dependent Clp protease proteolytic subunit [Candidatus Thiodiazotropha lotti]|nr:ATP-dependent Clp protease proteolytic subunit [Candidatus Thiodiazotropha lotti]MCW4194217.1 ATP-dependent Clp protease proteolytic subunit [Candidatus Thiodiazotropha lotti]